MFLFNILNNTKHTRCWDTFWHLTSSYYTKQYWHILYNTHKSFLMHWRTWRRAGTPRPCWAMLGPALAPWPNWDRGHGVSLTLASYHCLRKSQISMAKYGKKMSLYDFTALFLPGHASESFEHRTNGHNFVDQIAPHDGPTLHHETVAAPFSTPHVDVKWFTFGDYPNS